MSQAQFDEAVRRFGGALDSESAPAYSEFKAVFDHILSNGHVAAKNIYAGWVNNSSLNAVATRYYGQEFIGIFFGAQQEIYQTLLNMLADREILPEIFDNDLSKRTDSIEPIVLGQEDTFGFQPVDPTRLTAARNLAWNGVIFLFCHELSHHLRGHLEYLYHYDEREVDYIELPMAQLDERETRRRFLLELDADNFGSKNCLSLWRAWWAANWFPALEAAGLEISWSVSIATLFFVMSNAAARNSYSKNSTHPSPAMRFLQVSGTGMSPSHPYYVAPQEIFIKGFSSVKSWFERNHKAPLATDDEPENVLNALVAARTELNENHGRTLHRIALRREARLQSHI